MHKKRTRLLSLLLVGALLLGLYPLPGLAETSPPPQATQTDITESPPENEAAPSTEPDTGPQQPPADSETEEPTRQPTEETPPTPAEEPVQEPTQVPSQVPSENPAMLSLLEAMAQNGYAYVLTPPVPLYATEELTLPPLPRKRRCFWSTGLPPGIPWLKSGCSTKPMNWWWPMFPPQVCRKQH